MARRFFTPGTIAAVSSTFKTTQTLISATTVRPKMYSFVLSTLGAAADGVGKENAGAAESQAALHGWALAAGVPPSGILGFNQTPSAEGDAITLFDGLCEAYAFGHWGAWLERWRELGAHIDDLSRRALAAGFMVELVLCGRSSLRRVALRRTDRWRFWRRLDLRKLLAEDDNDLAVR